MERERNPVWYDKGPESIFSAESIYISFHGCSVSQYLKCKVEAIGQLKYFSDLKIDSVPLS